MEDTILKGFLEYGSAGLVAGAIIYIVRYMMDKMSTQQREERADHNAEVDKLAEVYRDSIEKIGAALKDSTDRIIAELRQEIRHEHDREEGK
ncbi:MAG: hypothetical protein E6Q97_00340 [Desulfurellales bacterium]|nr:MAG: hypothetical protein E6Q97_00340 [Desulfurellales bacterium]